jgi:hypothetical protein
MQCVLYVLFARNVRDALHVRCVLRAKCVHVRYVRDACNVCSMFYVHAMCVMRYMCDVCYVQNVCNVTCVMRAMCALCLFARNVRDVLHVRCVLRAKGV